MVDRPDYIRAIAPFINKPIVKILAGVRRCGKTTFLALLRKELLGQGISEARIISRRYTGMEFSPA